MTVAEQPLVSVVVPTYKRAAKIGPVLESILAQTLDDLEVVVVDDASGDETPTVVAAVGDPRIRLVTHETNQGGNAARRTGIAHSRGRYMAFLDSDDIWLPTKLERQLDLLRERGEGYGLCATWYVIENPDGSERARIEPVVDGVDVPELYIANWLGSYSTILVARAVLDEIGGPDPALRSCQDWDLYLRANRVTGICCVPEHLVRYLHDDDDPVRISGRRDSVVSGHRHVYGLMREHALDDDTYCASVVTFLRVFGDQGAPADVWRVARDVPLRLWSAPALRYAAHMGLRAARRSLARRRP